MISVSPVKFVFLGATPQGVQVVRAGKAAQVPWALILTVPSPASPYVPSAAPTITIIDPNGATQVTAQAMTAVTGQPGIYTFEYTTPSSPAAGQLGIWTAWVDVTDPNGNSAGSAYQVGQAKGTPVFQLV